MSIISGNRKDRRSTRRNAYVDAVIHSALTQPSKADLRAMLAEAARNTASAPMEEAPSTEAVVPK